MGLPPGQVSARRAAPQRSLTIQPERPPSDLSGSRPGQRAQGGSGALLALPAIRHPGPLSSHSALSVSSLRRQGHPPLPRMVTTPQLLMASDGRRRPPGMMHGQLSPRTQNSGRRWRIPSPSHSSRLAESARVRLAIRIERRAGVAVPAEPVVHEGSIIGELAGCAAGRQLPDGPGCHARTACGTTDQRASGPLRLSRAHRRPGPRSRWIENCTLTIAG